MTLKEVEDAVRKSLLCVYTAKAIAHLGEDYLTARELCNIASMRAANAAQARAAIPYWEQANSPDTVRRLTQSAERSERESRELQDRARALLGWGDT